MTTATHLSIPAITRRESYQIAQVAQARLLAVVDGLSPQDWSRPTACPAWSVRDVIVHLTAVGEGFLSPLEGMRQSRGGKRFSREHGLGVLDGYMQAAVAARSEWTPEQARSRATQVLPRFARRRLRFPGLLRRVVKIPGDEGSLRLDYLFDRIINRDTWMHRLDICQATGQDPVVTADHDGRLVEDLVAEWAQVHNQPFSLHLTGPAGGHWARGTGGESLELDALDFARILSGRGHGDGLLATAVLF